MPVATHRPAQLTGKVFRGTDATRTGLLTRHQLESRAWRRLRRNVYCDADLAVDHGIRVVAARLALPSITVTGASAAWLHGVRLAADDDPVVITADTRCRHAGLQRWPTPATHDRQVIDNISVASPAQTAADILRNLPGVEAVVLLDALLHSGRTNISQVRTLLTGRGDVRARRQLDRCDDRAESPQESRLRLLLDAAGLPAPVPQLVVRTAAGLFVARVDLGWPELRLAVEYDGAWHGAPGELANDRRRHNALVAAGWTVLHVTAADLRDPTAVLHQIRAAIAAATR